MKKISILLLAFVTVISFNACTDDDQLVFTAQPDPEGISFINTFSAEYILSDATDTNLAERFVWQSPDFGVDTPVTYELQGSATSTFDEIVNLGSTTENNLPITVKKMIELANAAGLDTDPDTSQVDEDGNPVLDDEGNPVPNTIGEVYLRLIASVGTQGGEPLTTDVQPVIFSLIETIDEEVPLLYVVGSFLDASGYGPNWTPANAPAISARSVGDTKYEGFVFINDANANYLFLPTNTSFDGKFGDSGASNGSYTEILIKDGGVDCGLPPDTGAGYFLLETDLTDEDNITYSVKPAEWAIVGGATPLGWPAGGTEGQAGNDHDMIYDAAAQVWTITIALAAGEFKFRANDDWALNLGDDAGGDGSMDFDGPNLSVDAAGTYLVTLDLSNPRGYEYSAVLQ